MVLWILTAVVLSWSLATGGATASGFTVDAFGQLVAVPLIAVAACVWWTFRTPANVGGMSRFGISPLLPVPLVLIVALVALQIWPIGLHSAGAALGVGSTVGIPAGAALPGDWRTVSVVPMATMAAGLSPLAPIAVFLATGCIDRAGRRALAAIVVGIGMISLALGLMQVAQGDASRLRFYPFTNTSEAVGLFANRNHFSAQLYIILLLGGAWLASRVGPLTRSLRRGSQASLELAGYAAFVFAVLAAAALSRSRAGMALTLVAIVAIALMARSAGRSSHRDSPRSSGALAMIIILGSASLFALQFGMQRIFSRFESAVIEDLRWPFLETTVAAIWNSLPFGTGLGSFVAIYGGIESTAHVFRGYANRAHNDLAEVLLETGLIGAVLLALFLIWFINRAVRVWRQPLDDDQLDGLLQRAASVAIALLLLHSLLDYPLRTTSNAVMFAFACALLLPAPQARMRAPVRQLEPSRRRSESSSAIPAVAPAPATPWKSGTEVQWPDAWQGERAKNEH